MKTGIFGGSFNPIHNGHIALAKKIKELAGLDEVWFMVSPHNPLKDADGLMPDGERLEMVEEALSGISGMKASDYEFQMPKPSYMLNTLQNLRQDYPDREFTLIIGADNWLVFDKWYKYEEILNSYKIAIYPRKGYDIDATALPESVRLIDTGLYDISSTQVRRLLKEGKPIDGLVPQCVVKKMEEKYGMKPKISVIIPIYNKEKYVEECLKSIMEQDFDAFEVIAVNDGSRDNSGTVCDTIAKKFPNLHVIHTENGGVTTARRIGYEQARGEYITFVDADDKLLPHALQRMYKEITITGADEVVARYEDQHGNVGGQRGGQYAQPEWIIKRLLAGNIDICILWGVLFRRELLAGCLNTPREIRSGEDIMMQMMCLLKKPKVWLSDEVVYMYNAGLPNDRPLSLDEQMLYDEILHDSFKSRLEEFGPYITLHQTKMYENFIGNRQFDVFSKYYSILRTADHSQLSLADRIAISLPPRLAYYPIALKKALQKK